MDNVFIPSTHAAVLEKLTRLGEEKFSTLVDVLTGKPSPSNRAELVGRIAKRMPEFDVIEADALLAAILNSQSLRERQAWTTATGAEVVAESDSLHLDGVERGLLQSWLKALLEVPYLYRIAKAIDLITDHEHVFHRARIITDVRTVFPEGPVGDPVGAVIVQMLKIEYHDDSGVKSIYFALDTDDVEQLAFTSARASEKAERIRSVLARADLPLLEWREDGSMAVVSLSRSAEEE